jgi:hypothetical protein
MRNIFIVNATQVVTSENHPEGLFSVVSGFPQNFDSINYNEDVEAALRAAKSAYYARLSANYAANNRAMTTVTLEQANGQLILRDSSGTFPVIVEPEPEPEEEVVEPENE